ncbi:MAG: hypothetical protein K6C14_00550 [Eubacterium sp.]|nr:hypothetical protein [Eubacterium sp.]
MAKRKKEYDDDDGRVIADMSDIEGSPLLIPRFKSFSKEKEEKSAEDESDSDNEYQLSGSERRAYIGGALGAALAIGAVFAIAGFIFIFFMTRIH